MADKPAPTPKRYAKLKKQAGRKGIQKGPEETAMRRVERHRKVTAAEAKAYITDRTAQGKSVGGFVPSAAQRKANDGTHKPTGKAARTARRTRAAEQKGNVTNKPQGHAVTLPPPAFVRPGSLAGSAPPSRRGKPPSRPVRASKD